MEKNILTISINKKEIAEILAYALKAYQEMNRKTQKDVEREKIENIKIPEGDTGFYSLTQLQEEVFPWGRTKILKMVDAGKFPAPIKGVGKRLLWPKEVIHNYINEIKERGILND